MTARRVFLHIGAPKTGTTYIQDRLTLNRASLAEHGVAFDITDPVQPGDLLHFHAAVDLIGHDWGAINEGAAGAWDRLVELTLAGPDTAIISHEIFASLEPATIERVRADLGPDTELHVVFGARDLGRQIPAGWQEEVKQGQTWSFADYFARLQRGHGHFGLAFDLPAVLGNWSAVVPPEHLHVVTVPHTREGGTLWLRYCAALGIDPEWAPVDSDRTNPSLGAAETAMLRRLNERLGRDRKAGMYDHLVRAVVAERALAVRGDKVTASSEMHAWASETAERWIAWLSERGFDVIGDLADLRPTPPSGDWIDPDRTTADEQLDAAIAGLAAVVEDAEEPLRLLPELEAEIVHEPRMLAQVARRLPRAAVSAGRLAVQGAASAARRLLRR